MPEAMTVEPVVGNEVKEDSRREEPKAQDLPDKIERRLSSPQVVLEKPSAPVVSPDPVKDISTAVPEPKSASTTIAAPVVPAQALAQTPEVTQSPILHKKPSRKHKLAALFESGQPQESTSTERSLRREGSGSVKNLAEQYENQARATTPALPPSPVKRSLSPEKRSLSPDKHSMSPERRPLSPEKRQFSRVLSRNQLGPGSPGRSDSKSPAREIDFAATVAASLQESGFDPGYVINDRSFHRSNSISSNHDISPDDDVFAAKERASRSRLGSLSRSSSVSGSPKMRPTRPVQPEVLPPIEVAMGSAPAASFDPLDVLNDPVFSSRRSPPGVLEEADPDELAASSSLRKNRGNKKRKPLAQTPPEITSVNVEEESSVAPTKRGKKLRKDEEQAPLLQDSVEYAATRTPAIETLPDVSLAVETPADSTVREAKLGQSLPIVSTETSDLSGSQSKAKGKAKAAQDNEEERSSKKSSKTKKEKSKQEDINGKRQAKDDPPSLPITFEQDPRSTTTAEREEYPFPQVEPKEKVLQSTMEQSHKKELERERDMDAWAPSSEKKGKKSRKEEEKIERGLEKGKERAAPVETPTKAQEHHKRRTHPVSFNEEQPNEKRLHKLESSEEPKFAAERTASPLATEQSWSFAGLRDNKEQVGSSAQEPSTTVQPELSKEAKAQKAKQRSKEPKTPATTPSRAVANFQDQEMEDSPALPEHRTYTGASTPSSEFATKERTSYLFDSSPSTRAYGTSPAVPPYTPVHDNQRVIDTPTKGKESRVTKKTHGESQHGRMSPTKEVKEKEPYKSIFGDPNEKTAEVSTPVATPTTRPERTPGNKQLESITETSPEDTTHKKSRSKTDVGQSDRALKSARRTESLRSFTDRLRSPPPRSPTPEGRQSVPPPGDSMAGRITPARESPWHQANESIDRTMALSPARRMPRSSPSADPIKQSIAEQRSPSVQSQRSLSNIARIRSPDYERPSSAWSSHSSHSLRRVDRQTSGDLRSAARLGGASAQDAKNAQSTLSSTVAAGTTAVIAGAPNYDPVRGEGKGRRTSMAETFEAWGEAQGSPISPSRPPSVRKRQSMQIIDLQTQLDQLAAQNESLESAKARAEESLQAAQSQRQVDEQLVQEEIEARDRAIHQRDIDIAQLKDTLKRLQEEIARLKEINNTLTDANRNLTNDANTRYAQLQSENRNLINEANARYAQLEAEKQNLIKDANERYARLQSEGQAVHDQWQTSQQELEQLRLQHTRMQQGLADAVRDEVGEALDQRNAEIDRLNAELASAREQIKTLQKQILASKKPSESFLTVRDEDYFDSACQQLCQHVQQWVLRFSKFSDTRACRLSSDIAADARLDQATRKKIDTRLDNAVLDGSDVDALLADRVRRRDVFMSVVMTMIWEYVFTRYLFGMDREQRQKLKALEKTLSEVGPPRAVAQWRAITLTLLSRREAFIQQRAQDTEAVVHEIYSTLSTLLPPPSNLQKQIQESLRNVMRLAVDLSIEMRTQRAEYIMLPPLQPEYDTNGDLVAKVTFNASLMNERSGETTSNDELQARGAIVKIVLFPLVVKKGDDFGEGEDEIVVCPAQVLVQGSRTKKVVRTTSGAMSINRPDSRSSRVSRMPSVAPPESTIMDYEKPGSNMF
jgi:hypothetical protein